jgi:hypothetical protein
MTPGQDTPDCDPRLREVAVAVALRTGLLRRCPTHGEVYDPGQHDYQGACMLAGYLVNRGDPLVAPFRGDRAPLTYLLKAICGGYGSACSGCSATAGVEPPIDGSTSLPDGRDHAPGSPVAGRCE